MESNLSEKKWRKFLSRVWLFKFIPFVDFVLASGSLATGNPRTERAEQSSYDGNPRTQGAEQSSYDGKAVWVYRHFPVEQLHPVKARAEAEALECANELGGNKSFWAYLDKLFEVT